MGSSGQWSVASNETRSKQDSLMAELTGGARWKKTGFVDQKAAARFGRVRAPVMAERLRFAVQGSVVSGWRVSTSAASGRRSGRADTRASRCIPGPMLGPNPAPGAPVAKGCSGD